MPIYIFEVKIKIFPYHINDNYKKNDKIMLQNIYITAYWGSFLMYLTIKSVFLSLIFVSCPVYPKVGLYIVFLFLYYTLPIFMMAV